METYKKWEPIEGIEAELWVEALHDDYEGLRILLRGNESSSPVLRITFSHYYVYRNADESYRLALWREAHFEERNWCLFTTTSSSLIDWLSSEAGDAYNKDEMHHYLIKTGADVIDVVTNKNEPKVEWLRKVGNAPEGARIVRLGKWGSYFNG